jgi:hypothetical protein
MNFKAICPCGDCDGETVEARTGGFTATTTETEACSVMRKAGLVAASWRKTVVVEVVEPPMRHKDGLIAFG